MMSESPETAKERSQLSTNGLNTNQEAHKTLEDAFEENLVVGENTSTYCTKDTT